MLVIDTEQVQDGGVPIAHTDLVFHGVQAQFVGASQGEAGLHASPGHPVAEGVFVVITTGFFLILVRGELRDRQPAEFAAPQHQGAVEQAALFEVA